MWTALLYILLLLLNEMKRKPMCFREKKSLISEINPCSQATEHVLQMETHQIHR